MEILPFQGLLIILGLSVVILLIGHRLSIPPVVGFLVTGVLAGPHGLKLVEDMKDVETLAQIGIILLLFGIGMEFSLKKLVQIKRLFLLGGGLQVGLTILFGFLTAQAMGDFWQASIFLGFLLSMSSTAVVLRMLEQKGESASPHGQVAIAILIFQDMVAIPMILFLPILAGSEKSQFNFSLLYPLIKGLAILLIVFFSAQRLVPQLLLHVARTRSKELFLVSVLTLCFGVAWLTSSLGLSLTIGAFLAGLIISESEYSNEAINNIFPFQALFISFFFVSIGMLLNLDFVLQHPFLIIVLATGVLLLKTLAAGLTAFLLGFPIRTAILTGIALSQVGEFSFVLGKTGISYGLGSDYDYQLFLGSALLTLAASPFLINLAPQLANMICRLPLPQKFLTGLHPHPQSAEPIHNHVIIIGFGISGRNLARSCKLAGIPYMVLEMNPDTVRGQKQLGEPIHFGDATHLASLEHLYLEKAKALAILVNDPLAAKQIVKVAREGNSSIYLIVRTRYMQEVALLNKLGADEVIPDEFGTSVEIFSRVLRQYYVPDENIYQFIADMRADGYEMLRHQYMASTKLADLKLDLAHLEIGAFRLHDHSPLVGKTLAESRLRHEFGLTVLLIKRDSHILSKPLPDTNFCVQDVVVAVGERASLKRAAKLFEEYV